MEEAYISAEELCRVVQQDSALVLRSEVRRAEGLGLRAPPLCCSARRCCFCCCCAPCNVPVGPLFGRRPALDFADRPGRPADQCCAKRPFCLVP